MQHHDCEDSVAGSDSATINVRLPPALHLRSLSIEVLDFLLLLSHGCCRHPVDRTFACLLLPILCGVALWLARSSRAEFTNSRGLVALVTRGLLSSLLIIAKQYVVERPCMELRLVVPTGRCAVPSPSFTYQAAGCCHGFSCLS